MKPIVDISVWQNPDLINYDKFAEAISGVILRGAYGIWKDKYFDRHYEEFSKRGVPIGSYHYIIGNYSGKVQAEAFHNITKGKTLKLGLWADVEDRNVTTGLTRTVVVDYMTNIESFVGKKVGIYTGVYAWYEIMQNMSTWYGDRTLWVAHYGVIKPSLPRYSAWTKWTMWQYSSSGRIDGYEYNIDMNYFNGTEEEYKKYFGIGTVTPPTEPEPPTNEVTLPKLKVTRTVNIRTQPTTSATATGYYVAGDIVEVLEIKPINAVSVWVRTVKGWSAVIHYGVKYME